MDLSLGAATSLVTLRRSSVVILSYKDSVNSLWEWVFKTSAPGAQLQCEKRTGSFVSAEHFSLASLPRFLMPARSDSRADLEQSQSGSAISPHQCPLPWFLEQKPSQTPSCLFLSPLPKLPAHPHPLGLPGTRTHLQRQARGDRQAPCFSKEAAVRNHSITKEITKSFRFPFLQTFQGFESDGIQ